MNCFIPLATSRGILYLIVPTKHILIYYTLSLNLLQCMEAKALKAAVKRAATKEPRAKNDVFDKIFSLSTSVNWFRIDSSIFEEIYRNIYFMIDYLFL